MAPTTLPKSPLRVIKRAAIHAQILFSVADHASRDSNNSQLTRHVGVLIGKYEGYTVEVTDSYAIPYEEDQVDSSISYLDMDYLKAFLEMLKKLESNDKIVGWYHEGRKILPGDSDIHQLISTLVPNPIFALVNLDCQAHEYPLKIFVTTEDMSSVTVDINKSFENIVVQIIHDQAENICIHHVLRFLPREYNGIMSDKVKQQMDALKSMISQLKYIDDYLLDVKKGKLRYNHVIFQKIQEMINLLRNLETKKVLPIIHKKHNDNMLSVYISIIGKSILKLNELLDNRIVQLSPQMKVASKYLGTSSGEANTSLNGLSKPAIAEK